MKRNLIAVILILSLVICLPACFSNEPQKTTDGTATSSTTSSTTSTSPKIEENPDFVTFNAMFDKEFTDYTIDITVTGYNGDEINEKYTVISKDGVRSVEYRIERLNEFTIDGDEIIAPEEYISVEEGIYDTEQSAADRFNVPTFNFSYAHLSESDVTIHNSYSTDITSLEHFMGLDVNASEASVKLTFSGETAKSIIVSYVTESDNTVTITYTFN